MKAKTKKRLAELERRKGDGDKVTIIVEYLTPEEAEAARKANNKDPHVILVSCPEELTRCEK